MGCLVGAIPWGIVMLGWGRQRPVWGLVLGLVPVYLGEGAILGGVVIASGVATVWGYWRWGCC